MSDKAALHNNSARFAPAEKLRVELIPKTETGPEADRAWGEEAQELLELVATPNPGRIRLVGEAGTGVTSLVIDSILARIRAGVSPQRIVVLATSKESAAQLRRELAVGLPQMGYVSDSPIVRSVHSFAFALLRQSVSRLNLSEADAELPLPRLITGAEHDVAIRELLQLQSEDPDNYWPREIEEALAFVGFGRQLRDFLLRAQERGLSAESLIGLGQEFGRPMWTAAGKFLQEYDQIMKLSGAVQFNAAELVSTAVAMLNDDEAFLHEQQSRIDTIVVDDAQQLDPRAAELVSLFAESANCTLVAGNPEHSVFHFRGATPKSLTEFDAKKVTRLTEVLRTSPNTEILWCDSPRTELEVVSNLLRRRHLIDGVEWKDMAVIVRSASAVARIRRSLLAAGVPVTIQPTDVVLSQQRLVSNLLLACKACTAPLSAHELEELVLGPIGGADTVSLRRLYRGLRRTQLGQDDPVRAADLFRTLATATIEPSDEDIQFLTDRENDILSSIRAVLRAGITASDDGASIEMILWEIWNATGLSDRLMNASLRGGALGSAADLDLDAVMTLFDAAGDFVERKPNSGLSQFIEYIVEQELPSGARDRRGFARNAVSILTAHATVGLEWITVAVAGVQEGTWPSLGETGSLFGQEELIDFLDSSVVPGTIIARTTERVQEERRLFRLAASRATESLMITAVLDSESDEVDEPSRFLRELAAKKNLQIKIVGQSELSAETMTNQQSLDYAPEKLDFPRLLSTPSIVSELRRVLENPLAAARMKQEAARQLAKLAHAGIPGANPNEWWGIGGPSTFEPVRNLSEPQRLSPSKIENGLDCPLRAVLGSMGEEAETPIHMIKGTLIHAAAEALANGGDREKIAELVTAAYLDHARPPQWRRDYDLGKWQFVLDRTLKYVADNEFIGAEVPVHVEVAQLANGTPISISGRMDLLQKNSSEELVVVDVKTGKVAPPAKEMSGHVQLMAYQLALSHGFLTSDEVRTRREGEPSLSLGGGELVYPAVENKALKKMEQAPKSEEELAGFALRLPDLVVELAGPQLISRVNKNCDKCQLKNICPVQDEGKHLTHV